MPQNRLEELLVLKEVMKGNLPITFKRKVIDMRILPFLTYSASKVQGLQNSNGYKIESGISRCARRHAKGRRWEKDSLAEIILGHVCRMH